MPNQTAAAEDGAPGDRQLIALLAEAEHLLASGSVTEATTARCRSLISAALSLSRIDFDSQIRISSATLTRREAAIAVAVGRGLTNAAIARKEFVSVNTVRFHVRNIYRKLHVSNRAEAAVAISKIWPANPASVESRTPPG